MQTMELKLKFCQNYCYMYSQLTFSRTY